MTCCLGKRKSCTFYITEICHFVVEMKEKEGLLHKDGKELDVIVVDGREKSPSFVSIEKPPSDRHAFDDVFISHTYIAFYYDQITHIWGKCEIAAIA